MKDNLGTNGDEVAFSLVSQNDKHLLLIASGFFLPCGTNTHEYAIQPRLVHSWQKDGFPLSRPNSLHCRCVRVLLCLWSPPPSLSPHRRPFIAPSPVPQKDFFSLLFARGATLKRRQAASQKGTFSVESYVSLASMSPAKNQFHSVGGPLV